MFFLYCVNLTCFRWFHGKIDRLKAEKLLLDIQTNGLFLVRESVHYPGDYTLSVYHKNKVEHYRIIYSKNKLTIDEEGYFDNLPGLVEVTHPRSHINQSFPSKCILRNSHVIESLDLFPVLISSRLNTSYQNIYMYIFGIM